MTTNVSQSNAMYVQQSFPDYRESFLSFIRQSYPGIRQLKFKQYRKYWKIRAQYGPRCLNASGYTLESTVSHFLDDVKRKIIQKPLVLDRYYSSLDIN